jgi:hypothetical protein
VAQNEPENAALFNPAPSFPQLQLCEGANIREESAADGFSSE